MIKKAIITSGPTREWIDPVRYISNASSGKMGYCIAKEILGWIDEVVYIYGNVHSPYNHIEGAKNIHAETTIDMKNELLKEIGSDTLVVMAAALADYKPKNQSDFKIKKSTLNSTFTIELDENPDVIKTISETIKSKQIQNTFLVGFAAETNDLEKNALAKLERKGLQLIIGNYVHKNEAGFGNIDTIVKVYSKLGMEKEIGPSSKEIISKEIVEFIKRKIT